MPNLPTPLPALEDNYIWLMRGAADHALVVDPGAAQPVEAALRHLGLRLHAVLITHHHADHIGALGSLRACHPEARVYAPHEPRVADADVRVAPGERVQLAAAGMAFEVLDLCGHTRSHVGYVGEGVVFCGDALFSLGCGRLFEGTPAQALAALDRLAALPEDTWVCCTHEYTQANARFAETVDPDNQALRARSAEVDALRARQLPTLPVTMATERACNPFLRSDTPAIRAALAQRLGYAPSTRLDCFAALRAWKDVFVA